MRRARGLTQQDYDQMSRLAAFRAANPGVTVEHGQFSTWEAVIPGTDGETFAARATLGELLDRLDELTRGADSQELRWLIRHRRDHEREGWQHERARLRARPDRPG